MTMCRFIEEPCNGKLLSTVLKTSGFREKLAEFTQYLLQLGLSMQSRRPKEDGKRVRYYRLNPDDIAFAVKVLEHRQQQRDEKEQRRREQDEKNAAYAARMQTMYGVGTASNPPNIEDGNNNCGGVDGEESPSDSWWEQVKYYAQVAIERFEYGVDAVKELLSTLTTDERWGVMLEFDDVAPVKFGELVAIAPDWVEWMA